MNIQFHISEENIFDSSRLYKASISQPHPKIGLEKPINVLPKSCLLAIIKLTLNLRNYRFALFAQFDTILNTLIFFFYFSILFDKLSCTIIFLSFWYIFLIFTTLSYLLSHCCSFNQIFPLLLIYNFLEYFLPFCCNKSTWDAHSNTLSTLYIINIII